MSVKEIALADIEAEEILASLERESRESLENDQEETPDGNPENVKIKTPAEIAAEAEALNRQRAQEKADRALKTKNEREAKKAAAIKAVEQAAAKIKRAGDAAHSVKVDRDGKSWTFNFFLEDGALHEPADAAAVKWAGTLDANEYAKIITALDQTEGPASWFIPCIPATKTNTAKFPNAAIAAAVKTCSAAGRIKIDQGRGFKYVAVRVKAVGNVEAGCRLFKRY